MPSAGRSPPPDWASQFLGGLADGSLDAPSPPPPPPVGQPLLDEQQQLFFEHFFDEMPPNMVPSVDPAHIFDLELPDDPTMWPDLLHRDFHGPATPSGLSIATTPTTNSYYDNLASPQLSPPHRPSPHAPPPDHTHTHPHPHPHSQSQSHTPNLDLNPFSRVQELIPRRHQAPMTTAPGLLNFGTDTNFAPNGYHPPPPAVAHDKDAEARTKVYSALTRNESAMTTAANSPAEIKDEPDEDEPATTTTPGGGGHGTNGSCCIKRRASDGADGADGADDSAAAAAAASTAASASAPKAAARKSRRRSLGGSAASSPRPTKKKAATPKRDNLTEAQKRENHIYSEQKRRNLIRQGFEELCALVPELRAGGYSKSAVLIHAADYMDNLKKGNAQLRGYLQQLEASPQF